MKNFIFLLTFLTIGFGYSQNLLTNGDFETGDATGWTGNAANVVTENGNSYNSANVEVAGNPYDVNLSQVLSLTPNANYTLSFDAWSDTNRPLIAGIGLNEAPWTASVQTFNLTTTSQNFSYTFTAPADVNSNSRVIFDMGSATGFVGIDNVVLEAAAAPSGPDVPAATPPNRPAADVISIFSNAYTNITIDTNSASWDNATVTDVQVDGNDTWKVDFGTDGAYWGIEFLNNPIDATGFTHLHMDIFVQGTVNPGAVWLPKLANFGTDAVANEIEYTYAFSPTDGGMWLSLDMPIANFNSVFGGSSAINNLKQMVVGSSNTLAGKTVYVDNVYFHKNTVLGVEDVDTNNAKLTISPNPVR